MSKIGYKEYTTDEYLQALEKREENEVKETVGSMLEKRKNTLDYKGLAKMVISKNAFYMHEVIKFLGLESTNRQQNIEIRKELAKELDKMGYELGAYKWPGRYIAKKKEFKIKWVKEEIK